MSDFLVFWKFRQFFLWFLKKFKNILDYNESLTFFLLLMPNCVSSIILNLTDVSNIVRKIAIFGEKKDVLFLVMLNKLKEYCNNDCEFHSYYLIVSWIPWNNKLLNWNKNLLNWTERTLKHMFNKCTKLTHFTSPL